MGKVLEISFRVQQSIIACSIFTFYRLFSTQNIGICGLSKLGPIDHEFKGDFMFLYRKISILHNFTDRNNSLALPEDNSAKEILNKIDQLLYLYI
jgi:hypothetical protein